MNKLGRLSICIFLLIVTACAPASTPVPMIVATPTPLPPRVTTEAISDVESFLSKLEKDRLMTGAVLIAQDGKVLLSKAYGMADRKQKIANTIQHRYYIGSITKQFTAMGIMVLVSQGKLNVQDLACKYLEECPEQWDKITIHHLLTHTSGIDDTKPKDAFDLAFEPGTSLLYSNNGFIQLAKIIKQVSGEPHSVFISQNVLSPLKMTNTGFGLNVENLAKGYGDPNSTLPIEDEDYSEYAGAGDMYSTVEDLLLWDQALYTENLIPRVYLDEIFAKQANIGENDDYGYGWFITANPTGGKVVGHSGLIAGYASVIYRSLEDHVVIIILTNQGFYNDTMVITIEKKIFPTNE